MTKAQRRKLHAAINSLSHEDLASIVNQQEFPRAKGAKIDALAKQFIGNAHRQVSPRKQQRG